MLEVGYGLASTNGYPVISHKYYMKMRKASLYNIYDLLLLDNRLYSLTHTPDITSGRGWTLVNVGFTMAIAILGEK